MGQMNATGFRQISLNISGKTPNGNKMEIYLKEVLKNGFLRDMIFSETNGRDDSFLNPG